MDFDVDFKEIVGTTISQAGNMSGIDFLEGNYLETR